MSTYQPHRSRGDGLLLVHCNAVVDERPDAYTRLTAEIGDDLARLLVYALAGSQGRRGSSSP